MSWRRRYGRSVPVQVLRPSCSSNEGGEGALSAGFSQDMAGGRDGTEMVSCSNDVFSWSGSKAQVNGPDSLNWRMKDRESTTTEEASAVSRTQVVGCPWTSVTRACQEEEATGERCNVPFCSEMASNWNNPLRSVVCMRPSSISFLVRAGFARPVQVGVLLAANGYWHLGNALSSRGRFSSPGQCALRSCLLLSFLPSNGQALQCGEYPA